jgi:hypothetical protein
MALACSPCASKSARSKSSPVTPRLLRVRGGTDQPAVVDAIRRAGGCLDGTGRCYWVEAGRLRQLEAELRAVADPLFRARQ